MASSVIFTATATVGETFSTTVAEATHAGGHSINILNGDNPIVVNTSKCVHFRWLSAARPT